MSQPTTADRDGVFVSYRRADSQASTARLVDNLRQHLGKDRVFLDLDSQRVGQPYTTQILDALGRSRLVLAVIGPSWLDSTDRGGARRIDDPADSVRQEIETALDTGVALIPVLVDGAAPPRPDELPVSLRPLAVIQRQRMSPEDWDYDLGRLLEAVERYGLHPRPPQRESSPEWDATTARRYQRSFKATRRRVLDAVAATVEGLRYADRRFLVEAARVDFRAGGRRVSAKVVDTGPGEACVVVEFRSAKTGVLAAGAGLLAIPTSGLSLAAWPALRAYEKQFAVGFLDNVAATLEGRPVGRDSVVPSALWDWRNRPRDV